MNRETKKIQALSACIGEVILSCPRCIFVGCPEVAYLALVCFRKIGIEPEIKWGRVPTFDGKEVHHYWLELPDLGLRVETNPSQILGWPLCIHVMPIRFMAEKYVNGETIEEMPIHPTPEGDLFYDRVSNEVVACYRKRMRRRR